MRLRCRSSSAGLAVLVGLAASSVSAAIVDLGVHGRLFDILEHDLRAVLRGQIDDIDPALFEREPDVLRDDLMARLPRYTLTRTDTTRLRRVDPTQVLERDLWAPLPQDDGSVRETLIAPRGTRINPLETIRPTTGFLIFDGDDAAQRAFALDIAEWTHELKLVLSRGNPWDLAEAHDLPVAYLQPDMQALFRLEHTPSIAWAGDGEDRGYLLILELAPEYRREAIVPYWQPRAPGLALPAVLSEEEP